MATQVESWQATNKSRRKACGECRRLKLRCEKIFPCESCQKRGCAAICPDGSFMKGTRSLKTSALKLHEKMAQMSARIQQLEEALAILQASISAEPHPLLLGVEDDERSRSPIPIAAAHEAHVPDNETPDELSEALGTLTIRPFGESQFHGETASSEYLLQVNTNQSIMASTTGWDGSRLGLPPDIILLSVLFPFPPSIPGEPINGDRFIPFLPEYPEALRICDIYFTNFSWCSMPISKAELLESIIVEVYSDGRHPITLQQMSLHRLSLLMMVFALGCLFDVEKPLFPCEAEEYHSLARAALCGEQIFNNTTIDCVQSMSLMIWYMRLFEPISFFLLFDSLISLFDSISDVLVEEVLVICGLFRGCCPSSYRLIDRESGKTINTAEIIRRQTTFWEYISGDVWQSFVYGRPSSMVFSQIDCKKPREIGGGLAGTPEGLFYKWKYSFTHLVGDVLSQTTGATTASYRGILDLERKLRDFPVPPELQLPEPGSPGTLREVPITLTLQRYVIRLWQHTTIMYIHRRFLVQAIRTNADDLPQSPYAQSVSAAYESACIQIMDLRDLYAAHQRLVSRMHPYWSHGFSASIVLGAIVARSPSCHISTSAMAHLDQACDLFCDAAGRSVQPPGSLEVMTNLQRKARFALAQHESCLEENPQTSDELVALGARGQVLEPSTKLRTIPSSSPKSIPRSPEDVGSMYLPQVGLGSSTGRRGLPTPATSPSDVYNPSLRQSTQSQAHADYAAQWLQQQAYFPPQPGSEGQEMSDSSSGAGQLELSSSMDQSEWPHGFMRSMGV